MGFEQVRVDLKEWNGDSHLPGEELARERYEALQQKVIGSTVSSYKVEVEDREVAYYDYRCGGLRSSRKKSRCEERLRPHALAYTREIEPDYWRITLKEFPKDLIDSACPCPEDVSRFWRGMAFNDSDYDSSTISPGDLFSLYFERDPQLAGLLEFMKIESDAMSFDERLIRAVADLVTSDHCTLNNLDYGYNEVKVVYRMLDAILEGTIDKATLAKRVDDLKAAWLTSER